MEEKYLTEGEAGIAIARLDSRGLKIREMGLHYDFSEARSAWLRHSDLKDYLPQINSICQQVGV